MSWRHLIGQRPHGRGCKWPYLATGQKSHDLTWEDRHTWVSENWMRVNVMSKCMNMDELLCSKLMDEVHEES